MGQFSNIAIILLALVAQLWVTQFPAARYVWILYAAAAVLAACCGAKDASALSPDVGVDSRERGWVQPRQRAMLLRLWLICVAVAATGLATEWSAAARLPAATLAAWLLSFAALSAAVWGMRVSPRRDAAEPLTTSEAASLAALLVLALLLRTLWIDELPRVYFADESRAGMFVRHAYRNGLPNPFTMGWNSWSMIGLSLQGLWAPWLGLNTVSVRLASALFGTLTVAATYLLSRQLFDRRTALVAAAFLACNRTAIDFSRLGTTHAQAMLVETMTFFALWRAIRTGSAVSYVWTGILAALCLHTYNAAHVVPLLLAGWVVITAVARPRAIGTYLQGGALALAAFSLVSLPWMYYLTDHYSFGHNWIEFTWMAHSRQVTPQILGAWNEHGVIAAARLLGSQVWKTWLGFTAIPAEAYQLGYRGGGMLDHVSGALFVVGLGLAAVGRTPGRFLLYWWGVTTIAGGVITIDPPAFVRLVGLVPAVCILAALPVRLLLRTPSPTNRSGQVAAALLMLTCFADNWRTYFVDFASTSAEDMSELVHFVRRLPPQSPVYLLGAENFLHFTSDVNVQQFVFDFPDRQLEDVAEPAHFLPIRQPDLASSTYLILAPTQFTLMDYALRLYPHSESGEIRHRATRRVFFRYLRLTPGDLAAAASTAKPPGLGVTFHKYGEVVLQRTDPQLNVYALEGFFHATMGLPLEAPFNADWQGSLHVPAAGIYAFDLISSGAASIDLGNQRVCNLSNVVPEQPQSCLFTATLAPGSTTLRAHWEARATEHSARQQFQLFWVPPGGERTLIAPDSFVSPDDNPPSD